MMHKADWLVPGLAVMSLLLVGVVGFFSLLLAFNGVSEAKATPLIIAYPLLLLAILVLTFRAGRWSLQSLGGRTNWSFWLRAPIAFLATVTAATAVLIIVFSILVLIGAG
jgi:hypothetical protein